MNPDEDVELEDASVTEAVAALLSELPKPVQDFVTGPERARIALSLSQKYNLHADQAGEFEHAYMFMLLGVSSPEEFVDSLTKAGIPAENVRGLAKDVNEQVFVPLRRAEQGARQSAPKPETLLSDREPQALLPGSGEPVPVSVARTARTPQIPPPSLVPPPYFASPQMPTQMLYPAPGTPIYMWPAPAMGQWSEPNTSTAPSAPPTLPIQPPVPERIHTPAPHARTMPVPTPHPAPILEQSVMQATPRVPVAHDTDAYREPVV